MAKLSAIIMVGALLTPHLAVAQDYGDEICTKDGHVQMFDASPDMWAQTGGLCTPRGPNGPVNGETRCGSIGFTVKYVARLDRWKNTGDKCGLHSQFPTELNRGLGHTFMP